MAPTNETWVYAGRRLGKGDKVAHAWIDPSDRELWFAKIKGTAIGCAYDVSVTRADDTVSVHGDATFVGTDTFVAARVTREQTDEWRARDAAVRQQVDAKRAEKRAAADDELDAALNVVRRHYARLRSYGERRAFVEYVAAETSRPARDEVV